MLTREDLREIRSIEIRTRRLVQDQLAGSYHSVFKGRGMSFDSVRVYQPGDDIRRIDWNVSARTSDVHVKEFVEERELTVMILVDMSASLDFGTRVESKRRVAAKLAALLAFSAIENNDRVGLVLFTEEVERYIPPKKGRKHVLRLLSEIMAYQPTHTGTNVDASMEFLLRVARRTAVAFLVKHDRSRIGTPCPHEHGRHHSAAQQTVDLEQASHHLLYRSRIRPSPARSAPGPQACLRQAAKTGPVRYRPHRIRPRCGGP